MSAELNLSLGTSGTGQTITCEVWLASGLVGTVACPEQAAPGWYAGDFPIVDAGTYLLRWLSSGSPIVGVNDSVFEWSGTAEVTLHGLPATLWSYTDRQLTAFSFSAGASAADVWAYSTRLVTNTIPTAEQIVVHLLDYDTSAHTLPNTPATQWRTVADVLGDVMANYPSQYSVGQLGYLIGKLDVGAPTTPVYVLPSPPAAFDKCRVVGYFVGIAFQVPFDSTLLFEFVTVEDAPSKAGRILVGRAVSAGIDANGNLTDGTNLWIDLERNDTAEPSGSFWRVTFADARLTRKTFQLNTGVFDLSSIVS